MKLRRLWWAFDKKNSNPQTQAKLRPNRPTSRYLALQVSSNLLRQVFGMRNTLSSFVFRLSSFVLALFSAISIQGCGRIWGGITWFNNPNTVIPEITQWLFVDGNGVSGLTNSGQQAYFPTLIVFNNKLYASWTEYNPTTFQGNIYVRAYNGNDQSPSWTPVEGNGVNNGLNANNAHDASLPSLSVFNSKLYALWLEDSGTGVYQVRVKVYNGNDSAPNWAFVDGGSINVNPLINTNGFNATGPRLIVVGGTLYGMWLENDNSNGKFLVRARSYNGIDGAPVWTTIDGGSGLNWNSAASSPDYLSVISFNSNLYSTWREGDAGYNNRVTSYNGVSWNFVDGNVAATPMLEQPGWTGATASGLGVFNHKLYFTACAASAGNLQVRASVYNGNDASPNWNFVDGGGTNGLNYNSTYNGEYSYIGPANGRLYLNWAEDNGTGNLQIRFLSYNGNDNSPLWTFVDGNQVNGLNYNPNVPGANPSFVNFNSKVYAIWWEITGPDTVRVKVGY